MTTRARRRRTPIVTVELRIAELHVQSRGGSLSVRASQLQVQLRQELGLEQQQLELALASARAPTADGSSSSVPTTSALVRRPSKCPDCKRWGYHLRECPRRSRRVDATTTPRVEKGGA